MTVATIVAVETCVTVVICVIVVTCVTVVTSVTVLTYVRVTTSLIIVTCQTHVTFVWHNCQALTSYLVVYAKGRDWSFQHVENSLEMLVSYIYIHISVRLKCVQKVSYWISIPNQTHLTFVSYDDFTERRYVILASQQNMLESWHWFIWFLHYLKLEKNPAISKHIHCYT